MKRRVLQLRRIYDKTALKVSTSNNEYMATKLLSSAEVRRYHISPAETSQIHKPRFRHQMLTLIHPMQALPPGGVAG